MAIVSFNIELVAEVPVTINESSREEGQSYVDLITDAVTSFMENNDLNELDFQVKIVGDVIGADQSGASAAEHSVRKRLPLINHVLEPLIQLCCHHLTNFPGLFCLFGKGEKMQQVTDIPECTVCHAKEMELFYSKSSGVMAYCIECGYSCVAANEHIHAEQINLLVG